MCASFGIEVLVYLHAIIIKILIVYLEKIVKSGEGGKQGKKKKTLEKRKKIGRKRNLGIKRKIMEKWVFCKHIFLNLHHIPDLFFIIYQTYIGFGLYLGEILYNS
ncbi:hypothetical protein FTO70_00265 [Methanosarcina sp. KYL-1]|uniref:hypothetical protein n=1 Tax=Methanosarcina sp. KYL-1 TaxID=2602068 RepID=UPI002100BA96|nr:hypothetical protein [Methanosarcina sp. KYL-1]MCQ1534154.1 hypothetical protein [Methanosarcina sp. KYL-1]